MKILFDLIASQPSQGKFHGAGEYSWTVLERLLDKKKDQTIECFYNPELWLNPTIKEKLKKEALTIHQVANKKEIQHLIKTGNYDKFYSALPYNYFDLDFSSVNLIFSFHGLRDLEMSKDKFELKYAQNSKDFLRFFLKIVFKKFYHKIKKKNFRKLLEIKAKKYDLILPTLHTKYALLGYLPFIFKKEIKFHVLYCPAKKRPHFNQEESLTLKKYFLKKADFFLIISANRWIKNSYRALKALDSIYSNFPEVTIKTVVLGIDNSKKFSSYVKNKDKFLFLNYLEEEELEVFYKNAFLFIYPTLNEGFGYPPLEAMKYGTPSICSAISSVPEVCQNSVIYFNPFSIEEIKNRILNFIFEQNEKEREKHQLLAKERHDSVFSKQEDDLNKICNLILN